MRSEAGFTLMETIVALVIFTTVVIALERGSALGWRSIRLAESERDALALARAKLASAGIDTQLSDDLDETGKDNRFQWHLLARKYDAPEGTTLSPRLTAYWVSVAVSWRDRPVGPPRSVELKTMKLAVTP